MTDVNDIARVMREAFHIATTGRPGPVLIDLPKNVQLAQTVPDYDAPMNLPGYRVEQSAGRRRTRSPSWPRLIRRAKRPVIYAGGGIIAAGASEELTALVRKTGIPVTTTLMGLGALSRRRSALARTCSACTAASTPTTPSTTPTCCWPWACGSTTA